MSSPSPAVRALIDAMSANFPDVGGQVTDAAEARAMLATPPADPGSLRPVAEVRDQLIEGPGGPLPLRLYWPHAHQGTPALCVFAHGGGWVLCDLDTHDNTARRVANDTGSIVVSVDYRRAPEHRYPAALEDTMAALEWTVAHAGELGGDPGRLVMMGDSAGGNLAAAAALCARDRGGPAVALQVLVYPVLDRRFDTGSYASFGQDHFLTAAHMRWYWDQYLGPEGDGTHPYASPLRGALAGMPPAYVVVGGLDPLRDEGRAYALGLADAGVAVTLQEAAGLFHGFFGVAEVLEDADVQVAQALAAVRAILSRPSDPGR